MNDTVLGHAQTASLTSDDLTAIAWAATRAPSVHNTQPWALRARPDGLEVHEDLTRALPVVDRFGRGRLISCGAATYSATVAVAHLGWAPQTALLPDPANPRHLATVTARAPQPPTADDERLYAAIAHRRTHRRVFMPAPPRRDLTEALVEAVRGHGAWLHVVVPARRERLADLLWRAARAQADDEAFRAEIGGWLRVAGEGTDGVPIGSLGTAPYPIDGLVTGTLPAGEGTPEWVAEELGRATVAVLFTRGDDPADWLRAGMALQHLLLLATADGLVASFADQPVQQTRMRPELAATLGEPGHAQAIIRLGEPLVTVPPTPRRPLDEVFLR
jgi:hypothetical protein